MIAQTLRFPPFAFLSVVCILHGACCMKQCADRSYDGLCPEGWTQTDASHCAAPLSYTGPCDTLATLAGAGREAKLSFAKACQVDWPCTDGCAQDFRVACPVGWLDRGDGVCDAPFTYSGTCPRHAQMWDDQFKRDFGIRCNVAWPCEKSCVEDFSQSCPTGWFQIDGVCQVVPTKTYSYSGPCPPFANLQNFTAAQKELFATACDLEFCATAASADSETECEPTADQPCPNGWTHVGTEIGYCNGVDYSGPCRPVVSVSDLAAIGKKRFMKACAVEWPCTVPLGVENQRAEIQAIMESSIPRMLSGPIEDGGKIIIAQP